MPTKQWMKERQLVTFWLLKEEYAEFVQACKDAGLTQAKALRQTVRILCPTPTMDGETGGKDSPAADTSASAPSPAVPSPRRATGHSAVAPAGDGIATEAGGAA